MAKSREKVQQLGIWDVEVDSPDHDAMCVWAYKNADDVLRIARPDLFDRDWIDKEVSPASAREGIDATPGLREFLKNNPRPNPKVSKKTLEFVLRSFHGHRDSYEKVVGYADVLIEASLPFVSGLYEKDEDMRPSSFGVQWSGRDDRLSERLLVEAKSKIETVGALMRQINLYRTVFSGTAVIISPDDEFSEIIMDHGIRFIKFDPKWLR